MHILNLIQADSGMFRTLAYLDKYCFTPIQTCSARSNISLSSILCKTKNFQTWNQKYLMCVILGFKFENLLLHLKSAPTNQSKCEVPRKDKKSLTLGQKMLFSRYLYTKILKQTLIFGISTLKLVKRQVVRHKKFQLWN